MARSRFTTLLLHGVMAAWAVLAVATPGLASPVSASERIDRTEPLPERLRGVDVRERLGDAMPRDVAFTDETGKAVKFGDLFDGKHPVVLTLNYSRCPMLCSLELNGLVTALKQLDWRVGSEFKIATVVLDPRDTPGQAQQSKNRYLRQYGRDAKAGWTFLTGSDASIHRIADAVGFSFGFNEKRNEYVHPAAIMILSPDGKVARYLYGIEYH